MNLHQARAQLKRLVRWYLQPSGLILAAAILCACVAVVIRQPWLALGVVALMAIFLPYRLSRQQGVAEDRLMAEVRRLQQRHAASEEALRSHEVAQDAALAQLADTLTEVKEIMRAWQPDLETITVLQSDFTKMRMLQNERIDVLSTRMDEIARGGIYEAATKSELDATRMKIDDLSERLRRVPGDLDLAGFNAQLEAMSGALTQLTTQAEETKLADVTSGLDRAIADSQMLSSEIDALFTRETLSGAATAATFQQFDRTVSPSDLAELRAWCSPLGIKLDEKSIGYLGHEVRLTEDMLLGRMAGSLGSAVLRSMVLQAVSASSPHVLEIGSLFGISIAALERSCFGAVSEPRYTAIDPLDGYYNTAPKDILTGVPVSETVFWENIRRAGIPSERIDLVRYLSTDEQALEAVPARSVDMFFIDGDHTRFGVEFDFRNYLHTVKPAGFVVFDDYQSKDWPDVEEFVNDEVMNDERLVFVGAGWETAVFRVVQ